METLNFIKELIIIITGVIRIIKTIKEITFKSTKKNIK